jgi:hypothetical protein
MRLFVTQVRKRRKKNLSANEEKENSVPEAKDTCANVRVYNVKKPMLR